MIWNTFTIIAAMVIGCIVIETICETIIEIYKQKNKNK